MFLMVYKFVCWFKISHLYVLDGGFPERTNSNIPYSQMDFNLILYISSTCI